MKLKKLIPELVSEIIIAGLDQHPKEIQSLCIPKMKSGADLFVIAPNGEGKSTAIVIGLIQLLKEAVEMAPRAIVMVQTREAAFAMDELFKTLARRTDLRSFLVFDEGVVHYQKDKIYEGVDVVIGTPNRLNELISTTGIPLTKIKHFIVDDTDVLSLNNYSKIYRIADNVEKAQFMIFANEWKDNFQRIEDRIMRNPLMIEASEVIETPESL